MKSLMSRVAPQQTKKEMLEEVKKCYRRPITGDPTQVEVSSDPV